MPCRLCVLAVSTLRILAASTDKTGVERRDGIVVVVTQRAVDEQSGVAVVPTRVRTAGGRWRAKTLFPVSLSGSGASGRSYDDRQGARALSCWRRVLCDRHDLRASPRRRRIPVLLRRPRQLQLTAGCRADPGFPGCFLRPGRDSHWNSESGSKPCCPSRARVRNGPTARRSTGGTGRPTLRRDECELIEVRDGDDDGIQFVGSW
jgi:hypothetical protein